MKRSGGACREIRVDANASRLERLGRTADETDDVVAHCGDRQTFNGLPEPKLPPRAAVHRGQQRLVLLLARDFDARGEQAARLRRALRKIAQSLRHRGAGGHRQREAAGHELVHRLDARQAALAQLRKFRDARAHQIVAGATRPEAQLARGERALDCGGEPRQLAEHFLVGAVVAPDVLGQRRERTFHGEDPRRQPAGDRQREERHHPGRINLDQALQQAARLARRATSVQHQEPRIAVGVQVGIGMGDPGTVADLAAHGHVAIEMLEDRCRFRHLAAGGNKRGVGDSVRPGIAASQSAGTNVVAGSLDGHGLRPGMNSAYGENSPWRWDLRTARLWPIVAGRHGLGDTQERTMSHQPPKESKKKAQHTLKEKKTIKQQKKQASGTAPFIKH